LRPENLHGGLAGRKEATSPVEKEGAMYGSRAHSSPKRVIIMLFGLMVLAALAWPQSAVAVRRVSVGMQINAGNYNYLADYGEWVEVPQFGMVWHPYVVAGWEPFFNGHWSWTYDGWAWISYEPFGWLVYHYGYWYYRPMIGWFWVPGSIWSPARVQWYTYGDYCAWAPMPPPGFYWRDPWDRWDVNVWVVVNINHFTDEDIGHHRIAEPPRREIIKRDMWVKRAPSIRQVETVTQRKIPAMKITREPANVRPETAKAPTRYTRPREAVPQRMVLPEREVNKVKQYAPKVEREVLVPREKAKRQEPQRTPEKKSGDTQKKTIKKR
jgi:hypothetical protein